MALLTETQASPRSSMLGGEVARRGLLALAPRSRISRTVGVVTMAVVILLLLSAATLLAGFVCAVLLGVTAWLVWPPPGRDRSRLDRWIVRRRYRVRHARGLDSYTRPEQLRAGSVGAWETPAPIGRVTPLDLSGTPWSRLFILHHAPTGAHQFLTVLLSTSGLGAGLWTDEQHAATQESFGSLLASIAKPGRWLSDLGQISRTLPQDLTEHSGLLAAQLNPPPADAPRAVRTAFRQLLVSYDQVVALEANRCEEHRNYLVARVDLTDEFQLAAAQVAPGPAGWAKLVRDELVQLTSRASSAGLGRVEVLGEQRTVAALRALQSPDYQPDRHGGLTWQDAFLGFHATATELVVDERDGTDPRNGWYTRVACIPVHGMEAVQLGPRWLAPVLVDMSPAVVRTVATRIRPTAASTARVEAVKDATTDTSATLTATAEGKIDDGTARVMLDASTRRLLDLAPGSGHAGAQWAIFIAVQAASKQVLDDACRDMNEAAADASITELDWLKHEQDLAWPAVLGLGRGVRW
ncbi:MAG TPA: SCO6880 family protein [Jatrophihabitans sp.]|jgi:hypothetical protein|nr:SCO6880 family protein [Jatrophihabitans sp.]